MTFPIACALRPQLGHQRDSFTLMPVSLRHSLHGSNPHDRVFAAKFTRAIRLTFHSRSQQFANCLCRRSSAVTSRKVIMGIEA